jgi:hypothetical protein
MVTGVLAVGWTMTAWGQASKAQGTVTVGTTKVAITQGVAVGYTTPNGQLVSVLLSDKPADPKAFAADTRIGAGERYVPAIFEGAWKGQHFAKRFSGFVFTIGPKGAVLSEEYLVGGRDKTFSIGNDEYVVELKSTAPRLVGSIKTKTPLVDVGGGRTVGVAATFDLPVATSGK